MKASKIKNLFWVSKIIKKLIINDPLLCIVKTAKHVSSTRKDTPESKQ